MHLSTHTVRAHTDERTLSTITRKMQLYDTKMTISLMVRNWTLTTRGRPKEAQPKNRATPGRHLYVRSSLTASHDADPASSRHSEPMMGRSGGWLRYSTVRRTDILIFI